MIVLEHGKIYLTADGKSKVRIRKEKWDSCYVGLSAENNTLMGHYDKYGTTLEGSPELANLVSEVNVG